MFLFHLYVRLVLYCYILDFLVMNSLTDNSSCTDSQLLMPPININVSKDYYKQLKKALYIEKPKDFNFVRVGNPYDGGYVMLDDFCTGDFIAYSFGISNDVSWDSDMADKGFEIYMYDHTIDNLPLSIDNFHYFKQGIAQKPNPEELLDTLDNFILQNNHQNCNNMILKMDVEGCEWEVLNNIKSDTLNKFDQIVLEFHNVIRACDDKNAEAKINALKKLNKTHKPVHLHGNNCAYHICIEDTLYPDVIEVTYIKKSKYSTCKDDVLFPTSLDRPCDPCREDLVLGFWNR